MGNRINIQGTGFDNIDYKKFMENFRGFLQGDQKRTVAFINAHCVNITRKDKEYKDIINSFDLVLGDGTGLSLACAANGTPLKENLNGTDLMPKIFKDMAPSEITFFFIGGMPGVASEARNRLLKKCPGLKIVGCEHGYFDNTQGKNIVSRINETRPDVVLVAMGVPRQEKWIFYNKDSMETKVLMAVGGFFDFASGAIKRAPRWVRQMRMEWLYRLIQEPGRLWRRYIFGNAEFLYYIYKDFLKNF